MFSRFLSLVLILILSAGTAAPVSTPAARVKPGGHPAAADASQAMPGDLLRAFLDSTARPVAHTPAGYQARLAGLEVTFGADGLHASAADLSWGLALTGLGRAGSLARPAPAEIAQAAERLEYRRGNLTEWYRHTPLGVEQGFTLHQAPPGEGPLTVQLAVRGELAASADASGGGLSFTSPGGQALRYDHLFAWDAAGTPLEARMAYAVGQVSITVDDHAATYPITIDPLIYAEQKVIAGGDAEDQFGYSVAVYENTALVGAPYDDINGNANQGSAYVFTRSAGVWTQQARLSLPICVPAAAASHSVKRRSQVALRGWPAPLICPW
ncbi:MAG: FG-GAP repeat protein [Chloroflexota bacterium]